MPKIHIKSTYSLDPATVMEVNQMAKKWKVPKSEVIRKAVHAAALRQDELAPAYSSPEDALAALQAEPRLSEDQANAWMRDVIEERRSR